MVGVAQLVRAPVCGTGGRGFKSLRPPHVLQLTIKDLIKIYKVLCFLYKVIDLVTKYSILKVCLKIT